MSFDAPAPQPLSRLGRAARWYAVERGWRVFPLHSIRSQGSVCSCGKRACTAPGKHPRTPRGCLDATTDVAQITAWWEQWPDAGVGIATGGGLIVIDVDPRHDGDDTMRELAGRLGPLPDTVEALTGGGGRHVYLTAPEGVRNSASALGPGVDVRGEGGYVVAPPSVHASGRAYGWEASSRPEEVPVAAVPAGWLSAMTPRPRLRVVAGGKGEPFPEGERNNSLYRRACSMRSAGFDRDAILAAITAENEARCVPPLDPAEVKGIAESAARHPEGLSPEYQAAREAASKPAIVAEPTAAADGDWVAALYTSKGGAVKNTFANLCAILRNDTAYSTLRHNGMTLSPEIGGQAVTDARMGLIREEIEHRYGFSPSAEGVAQALVAVASERSYHPVQEYLGGLVWDGVERLTDASADYLGAATPVDRTMLRAWFVSAVARALSPGCKVDTVLVLVGPQGYYKSSFFDTLAGPGWFTDSHVDLSNKDVYMQLARSWVVEWGEIERITARRGSDEVKSFISSRTDTFRPPYGRTVMAVPRSCVIVGSTNEDAFLQDPTGARRFWCIRVTRCIDTAAVAAARDQLWAEAVAAYRAGEGWWLAPEAAAAQTAASEAFRTVDPWEPPIAEWLAAADGPITTGRILAAVVALDLGKVSGREDQRVGAIMRRLGWTRHVVRVNGANTRVWRQS